MGAEETKKVQDNESKADKFVRLGEYRAVSYTHLTLPTTSFV